MAAFSRQCDTCARPRPPKPAVLTPVYPWVIVRVLYLSAFCWNSLKDFLEIYSYLPRAAAVSGSVKGCKMNPVKYGCKNPPKPQFKTWFLGHGFRTYLSFSSDGLKEREKTNASRFVLDALCSLIRRTFINAGPRRRINSIILLFALTKNTQTLQLLTACFNSTLIFQAAITV